MYGANPNIQKYRAPYKEFLIRRSVRVIYWAPTDVSQCRMVLAEARN